MILILLNERDYYGPIVGLKVIFIEKIQYYLLDRTIFRLNSYLIMLYQLFMSHDSIEHYF
jgi:hypothetical protein